MPYGDTYARFLNQPATPDDPFPNPTNDAQRVQNARARARRAGVDIGSGYLNPQSGELQDPDRGFMRYIGNHPALGAAIALAPAAPFLFGGGGGLAAGQAGVIPGTGIPTVAGAGGAAAGVSAPLGSIVPAAAGTATGATAGATAATTGASSILQKLLKPENLVSLAPVIAALASRGSNGSQQADSAALARQQQITETQMRRADPLHQAVTQLAYNRMPVSSRQGTTFDVLPLPR